MKKGFSLVELSVVLVIIGLLIGGLLAAKSVIKAAKIQKIVRDLGQYQVAVGNFKQNYKYYPGDEPSFTPTGDASGILESSNGCKGIYSANEQYQAFAQLSASGMIDQKYLPYTPTNCGGTQSVDAYGAMAGIIAPYTEVSRAANAFFTRSGVKTSIFLQKFPPYYALDGQNHNQNPGLIIFIDASNVVPLELKIGTTSTTQTGTGIGNFFGAPGICGSTAYTAVPCSDKTALYSNLSYYFSK